MVRRSSTRRPGALANHEMGRARVRLAYRRPGRGPPTPTPTPRAAHHHCVYSAARSTSIDPMAKKVQLTPCLRRIKFKYNFILFFSHKYSGCKLFFFTKIYRRFVRKWRRMTSRSASRGENARLRGLAQQQRETARSHGM